MGRNRKGGSNKRVLRRDFKQPRNDVWQGPRANGAQKGDGFPPNELHNEFFEEYYKNQDIVPPEEWEAFMETLRRPLPTTFRINGSGRYAADLRDKLERDFFSHVVSQPALVEGGVLQEPRALEWYPDKLAWQFDFSRSQLRKLPLLEEIHELLKRENEAGSITRQEAVSMVPPLFLDVRPHHRVLDTCAAPGSKTAQILEMLHAGTAMPTGFVIANDAEGRRCNLLTHQTKRMCSPCLVVTNHDATQYPLVAPVAYPKGEGVRFDRILCDVPCSGDGTIRKAPDIWRRWSFGNGNGLHPLQVRIAARAAYLLKVGGRMIYSTCTFNPVENEAVVAELLRRTGGAIRLLDCSNYLPGLRRVAGRTSWKVRDRQRFYSSFQEAVEAGSNRLISSMFPGEDAQRFNLHLCMRILPHHSDTGGFFISVLEKVAPLSFDPSLGPAPPPADPAVAQPAQQSVGPAVPEGTEGATVDPSGPAETAGVPEEATERTAAAEGLSIAAAASGEATASAGPGPSGDQGPINAAALPVWGPRGGGGRGREGGKWRSIDPVLPLTDTAILDSLTRFYGLDCSFPLASQLVMRSQMEIKRPKRLYFVSSGVKELLQMDETEQLKVTSTGLKVFERQESAAGVKEAGTQCSYRIAQEGLPLLLPYISRQIVRPTVAEFLRLLQERSICLPDSLVSSVSEEEEKVRAAAKANGTAPVEAGEAGPEEEPSAAAEEAGAAAPKLEEGQEPAPPPEAGAGAAGTPETAAEAANKRVKLDDGNSARPRIPWADPETLAQLACISPGCCVCTLREEEAVGLGLPGGGGNGALGAGTPLAVCCWRGRTSISLLIGKGERSQMMEKLMSALPPASPPSPSGGPASAGPGQAGEVAMDAGPEAALDDREAVLQAKPEVALQEEVVMEAKPAS